MRKAVVEGDIPEAIRLAEEALPSIFQVFATPAITAVYYKSPAHGADLP